MVDPDVRVNLRVLHLHQQTALNAIIANKGKVNPQIVCLPTGTGKTAVLISAPFVLGATRVLVIAPDLNIFYQISDALMGKREKPKSMVLRSLGIIDDKDSPPAVLPIDDTKKLTARDIQGQHIVIANAQKFLHNGKWCVHMDSELFDLVIVDEAHRLPSRQWAEIAEHFNNATLIFLTATPYRADESDILGSWLSLSNGAITYQYKLENAINE